LYGDLFNDDQLTGCFVAHLPQNISAELRIFDLPSIGLGRVLFHENPLAVPDPCHLPRESAWNTDWRFTLAE
jgi:hypothetical protein